MDGTGLAPVLCDIQNSVALVAINRPEAMNALNSKVFLELARIFDQLEADQTVKAIILTGSGNKAFAAGADISEMKNMSITDARKLARAVKETQDKIACISKPVIAAINGVALGGGCELAMCCDFRIASDNAKFGQPEINLGIIPGGGGTQRLPALVGLGRAKDMVMTGRVIGAGEALNMGLVSLVVPSDSLVAEARRMAATLAQKSPYALSMAKASLNQSTNTALETGLCYELECFVSCFSTDDQNEGMSAFIEKRKPVFSGR